MRASDFSISGSRNLVEIGGGLTAFLPPSLPPDVLPTWELMRILMQAQRAIEALVAALEQMPSARLLMPSILRQEAVYSSQIEGTRTTLPQLLLFEQARMEPDVSPRVRRDTQEVANYAAALEVGLKAIEARPVTLGLIKELHAILMRGDDGVRSPGSFRQSQNYIGGSGSGIAEAAYIPPPPIHVQSAMEALETYMSARDDRPPLVRLALIHYQFEAIHPFEDGNGRIGRMLITLLIVRDNLLPAPVLNLSKYLLQHRDDYVRLMLEVSRADSWLEWISFFVAGLDEMARDAALRAANVLALLTEYRERVRELGIRAAGRRLVEELFVRPVMDTGTVAAALGCSYNTAAQNIGRLIDCGLLEEMERRGRARYFIAPQIIDLITR